MNTTEYPQLIATEKRLIRLFMIGIFLFLVIFEAIFLVSRMVLEKYSQESHFRNETNAIITHLNHPRGDTVRPSNIGFLVLDSQGNVLKSRMAWYDIDDIDDIIESQIIDTLSLGEIHIYEELFIRKVAQTHSGEILLFIAPTNYSSDGVLRDIFRFLLMDIIILIPFFFVARTYVRGTLEPVRENMDTMTHFVHDAGHELKTPLAIISGNLQYLRDTQTEEQPIIHESLTVINEMSNSIDGLLELADLQLPKKTTSIPLYTAINREITYLKEEYPSIQIHNTVDESVSIQTNEQHLSILLRNLLENALKYNTPHGMVSIEFQKCTLTIRDTGIGIAPDDIPRIFDRFYRGNEWRAHRWSGIWLTLVEKILRLYGWNIHIESTVWSGTTISIVFRKK